ncbi:MAG: periplasmic serine protease, Do [Pseudomonadota bacterium]|jgi:serine protease Do
MENDVTQSQRFRPHRAAPSRAAVAVPMTVSRAARVLPWVLALPLVAALFLAVPALAQRAAPESFADLAQATLPAVVNISTTQKVDPSRTPVPMPEFPPGSPFEEFFRDYMERQQRNPNAPPRRATSLGSGFVIDPTGYIVTNNHVIEGADEITVIFQDEAQTELKAELVGTDEATDLALLRVKPVTKLQALAWGDSDAVRVGDWAVAIGNPFGLGGTVTAGIVSARARDLQQGNYDDFIQTDASINRGNSGGPLVNLKGEVIGINTAIFSQTGGSVGIGFAIPSAMAKSVITQLKEGGKVRRGWLGVQIQGITPEIAESMALTDTKGALVGSVTPGGPAEKSGIKPGDVIVRFDGREVNTSRNLPRMVAETGVGRAVTVEVIRRGDRERLSVELGELQQEVVAAAAPGATAPAPDEPETIAEVGIAVAALDDDLRRQFELSDQTKGVAVTRVDPGTPAAARQLRPGDVIVEVSQQEVATPADVKDKVARAKENGQRALLMLVERQGELLFVALSLEG